MFFVYGFNHAEEDFEVIGAFSKKEEADALVAEKKGGNASAPFACVERSWEYVIQEMCRLRLGAIANEIALATPAAVPWSGQVHIVWAPADPNDFDSITGRIVGIFRSEKDAEAAFRGVDGLRWKNVDLGKLPVAAAALKSAEAA